MTFDVAGVANFIVFAQDADHFQDHKCFFFEQMPWFVVNLFKAVFYEFLLYFCLFDFFFAEFTKHHASKNLKLGTLQTHFT